MPVTATDDFDGSSPALATPANLVALVAPSDTDELSHVTRGISFATAGALKVVTLGGETVVIPSGALAAGAIHSMRVRQVFATGTGALNIVAYW